MDSGRMNKLISITKATSTARSDDGAPVLTVTTISSNVWAEVVPITGRERWANNSPLYESDIDFKIRYSTLVTELCRVVYGSENYEIKKLINWREQNTELHILGRLVR